MEFGKHHSLQLLDNNYTMIFTKVLIIINLNSGIDVVEYGAKSELLSSTSVQGARCLILLCPFK